VSTTNRPRQALASVAVLALGFAGLAVGPQLAYACGATQTSDFGGTTSCTVSTPRKKSSGGSKVTAGGGSAGKASNPVGSYRLPTSNELRELLRRNLSDKVSDNDLRKLSAQTSTTPCVQGTNFAWSGSGYVRGATGGCLLRGLPAGGGGAGVVVPTITPEEAARSVIARLNFTAAAPGIGPDHDDNHLADDRTGAPFDAPVGYPLWLYADGGTIVARTVTESAGGMLVRISIKVDSITWSMGDGHSETCGIGTKWRKGAVEPATPSPTCGYTYEKTGRYTVTATTHWTINWAAGGQTGTIPFAIDRDRAYRVGELQTVIR